MLDYDAACSALVVEQENCHGTPLWSGLRKAHKGRRFVDCARSRGAV